MNKPLTLSRSRRDLRLTVRTYFMLQCPKCGRQYPAGVDSCPEDGASLRADVTTPASIPVDLLIGRVLDGKYRLDERLGVGGMGTVYRATHLLIDRPVAVKVLNPRLVTDDAAQERFRREARAAGRLRHANAVAVTDFGQTPEGLAYLVMELLEGHSLRDVLARDAPLDVARAVSLMLQVSAAVSAAHEAGIIHRDLKPGNIFIAQRPHAPHVVKVLDFGIAKVADDGLDGPCNTLTDTGVMIGTPRYMSPEQCDGTPLTPASDVYSLGVILYEMLTGQAPFNGPTPLSVALKHSAELPRPPRELVATLPPPLEEVVLHTLEKKPEKRPPDAGAFRQELHAVAERLGLEHAEAFGMPSIESLREAGIETPSGRLVVDIDRLRRGRAVEPHTAEDAAVADTGRGRIVTLEEQRAAHTGELSVQASATAQTPRAGGLRLRIPLRRDEQTWGQWLGQTPVLLTITAIAVVLVGLVFVMTRGERGGVPARGARVDDAGESIGRVLSTETGTPPRPTASPNVEPRTSAEFYERGAYNFSARNLDAAIRDFRRAVELQREFPEAYNRLGRALLMKGQYAEAVAAFRKAVEQRGGDYVTAQYNLGFALKMKGENVAALRAFDDAILKSGGKHPDASYQIGLIHLMERRDTDAANAFRKAIEQNNGQDSDAQQALGVALARQKDYAGAEAAFRAAIDGREGNFPEAHYNLGLLYQETDRAADAIREFEIYLRQQPNSEYRRAVENSLRKLRRAVTREGSDFQ